MAIKIGITDDVFLDSVTLDDSKAVLELTFKEVGRKRISHFEATAGDDIIEGRDGLAIKIWPPTPPKKEDMTAEKKIDLVAADINKAKAQFRLLLLGFYTSEDLKGIWNEVYAGTGIEQANYEQKILVEETLKLVFKNLCRKFMELIKPKLGHKDQPFRLLLVRQSQDKAFAALRGNYVEDNPFWEDMQIPKDQSKLKFTPYEIRMGLDNDLPSEKKADNKTDGGATSAAPVTAASVFGQ
jgi:hypothetical protein